MKSYLLKLGGREEGPYPDSQIAQMFADQRVNRSTPCKPEMGGDWRTIDDYLPTLKYGTQLPAPTRSAVTEIHSPRPVGLVVDQRVAVVDVDIPFPSILRMMFKVMGAWLIVLICVVPIIILFWAVFFALFAGIIGGMMSGLPHR